ncbi:hypothetical protein SCHPADRAFT_835655 [Schizopora paradoxa]|uniref:BTB domain-containing protein n=1 Tax=Schizopora paradoxa TaxID=27342 RepID=A0A0H2R9Y4_9AGAM|nr:hypothetical protein SCHPADRAFT_835655 [Schizopora paradoxa]
MDAKDEPEHRPVIRKPATGYWFEDGNVVLSADFGSAKKKGSPTELLFRVHKSQLSNHSKIFNDMFGLGDGMEQSSEMFQGVPLVHLHDSALDVKIMLAAIYYPLTLISIFDGNAKPLAKAIMLFRMLKKYDMTELMAEFIPHLTAKWPNSLSGWDRREDHIDMVIEDAQRDEMDATQEPEVYVPKTITITPDPVAAILFARYFDLKGIIPVAFYDLSRLDIEDDFDDPHCSGRPAQWSALPGLNYRSLLRGRERLIDQARGMLRMHSQKVPNHVKACMPGCAARYSEAFVLAMRLEEGNYDILRHLRHFASRYGGLAQDGTSHIYMQGGPCPSCCRELERGFKEVREAIWNKIPSVFR